MLCLAVILIVLCLQRNQTPLELAVLGGHSEIVYFFVKDLKMDITQFGQVQLCNIYTLQRNYTCVV